LKAGLLKKNGGFMALESYILHCSSCGEKPGLVAHRPQGRLEDQHRVTCACGWNNPEWSVSTLAAIRLWNSFVVLDIKEKYREKYKINFVDVDVDGLREN
jgi:hypothetical protein